MPRPLSGGFQTAAESDNSEVVHFVEIKFDGGQARISTGAVDTDWNGFTWVAVGGALVVGAVEESVDGSAQGVELSLSGVDQTVLSNLLNNNFRGHDVSVWRAHLSLTTGAILGTPLLLFKGVQLEPYTVEEQRGRERNTVRVSTRVSSLMSIRKVRGIICNVTGHAHHYAGDTFFQHTATLANKKIYWGTSEPTFNGPEVFPEHEGIDPDGGVPW